MKKNGFAAAFLVIPLSVITVNLNCFNTLLNVTASYDESEDNSIYLDDMILQPRKDRPNELMLYRYRGLEPNFVLPETVNGMAITGLDDGAFAHNKPNHSVVENVTLPDTIDYFGSGVFEESTVVSVNIPKKLRLIPSITFSNCKSLETVVFHDDIVSIAKSAFQKTTITIPQNLQEKISNDSRIQSLTSKSEFHSVNGDLKLLVATDMDTDTLYCNIEGYTGNSSELVLPVSIFDIPLRGVTIPNLDTSSITSITFPETTQNISVGEKTFNACPISELTLNSPCTLNKLSFGNCTNLKTLRFNDDATISREAFSGCTSLTSVEFCGKADLNQYTFMDCTALENVILDTSQPINGYAFDDCTSLMNINSQPVFDSTTGDFFPEYSDFIKDSFYMAEDVGFLNEYVKAQYKKIAEEVTSPDMSDTEKVKVLHDWVCRNTRYATGDTNSTEFHTDASILLNDSTVCEGYAKAFNLLCHSAGIESYYLHSSDHAWNIVKLGGHYFHVDTTWDDGENIGYSWFLKSDGEISVNNSHSKWKAYIPTSLHSFQKEGTPECRYQIGDVNQDEEISVADLVKMSRHVLGAETADADNIVLYDMNLDGNADAFDMILMRKTVTAQ